MIELEKLLGEAGRDGPRKDHESSQRQDNARPGGRRRERGAPIAVIEGDSHQTFIIEGDLTIVIGEKSWAE